MTSLGIVLATYNEAGNLPSLVAKLEDILDEFHLVVVDDSSPDGTSAVGLKLAERYGNIDVITRPGRQGLGTALGQGIDRALALGCDYVMTMDADHSHRPEDAVRLLRAAYQGTADLVLGSRHVSGAGASGWTLMSRLQSRLGNSMYRLFLGTPRDVTNNFRVLTRRCAELVATEARSSGFDFCPESVLIAMRHNLRIEEIPITFASRGDGISKRDAKQYVRNLGLLSSAFISFRLRVGRFVRAPVLKP